jgi:hypothetical protein
MAGWLRHLCSGNDGDNISEGSLGNDLWRRWQY